MQSRRLIFFILTCLFILCILAFPTAALQGAQDGLSAFLFSVLPALLPFFAGTSMLVRCGGAHWIARALQPVMRPLFGLGGVSALPFVMSAISGYPNGARITSELYQQGLLSASQAERTLALSSTAGPSFILSAVCAGMLGYPEAGPLLLACHLLSAVLTCQSARLLTPYQPPGKQILRPSGTDEPLARIFVESIRDSAQALWGVGAFILFFCALSEVLSTCGVLPFLARLLAIPLQAAGFSAALAPGLIAGCLELTTGCSILSTADVPLAQLLPFLAFLFSFGGACIIAQNYLFASQCRLRLSRLILYKAIQGLWAFVLCSVALPFFTPRATPTFGAVPAHFSGILASQMLLFLIGTGVLLLLGLGMIIFTHHWKKRLKQKSHA